MDVLLTVVDATTPDPALQTVVSSVVVAACVSGLFLVAQMLLSKRLRAPSDRLAEAQFGVQVYKDQVTEAREDKALNDDTITMLRGYVKQLETDSRADQELITSLYKQIRALQDRNFHKDERIRVLQSRIDRIAEKVGRGEPVLLSDLADPVGNPEPND